MRGSRPIPGESVLKYGGNTACVSVTIGERLIILDAGTGICNLGKALLHGKKPIEADIFISHVHWDHVLGLPFFAPLYQANNHFNVYGEPKNEMSFRNQMASIMRDPHFPVDMAHVEKQMTVKDIVVGDPLHIGDDIVITSASNNHPNKAVAYCVEHEGRKCCYVTDTEHHSYIDETLAALVKDADVMIYDANYTDEEYYGMGKGDSKRGWGHSTWQEAIKLSEYAGVKKLFLFHHDPDRDDASLELIERLAQSHFANCAAAKEGLILSI